MTTNRIGFLYKPILPCFVLLFVLTVLPASASISGPCGDEIVVREGDTLSLIADRCETTVEKLVEENGIRNPDMILVGQRLSIPEHGDVPTKTGTEHVYEIREGDTLESIARYHHTTVGELITANPQVQAQRRLAAGAVLRVPGQADAEEAQRQRYADWQDIDVEEGQTLEQIARYHHTTVNELLLANPQVQAQRALEAGERLAAPPPIDRRSEDRVLVEGIMTDEGVTCPALRDDEGRLFTLAGVDSFQEGVRYRITGRPAEVSICMQGTTLEVEVMERIDRPDSRDSDRGDTR
jgi:LysM repeat protein